MDFNLTEEQQMIREVAHRIAVEKIRPVAAHHDETGEFPWAVLKEIAKADLCGIYIDEKYGGMGMGTLALAIAIEELTWGCAGIAIGFAATGLGTFPILLHGSEEQKKKFLPQIASGSKLAAFGLTESGAGSDAGAVKTSAVKDGDCYILNGTKQWITNGGEAEIYSIIASTNPSKGTRGLSAFIVEKETPGFSFGKKEDKLGIRASATRELVFENCRVPAANLIGKEGRGFQVAMDTFDASRSGIGAQAVGIAQAALDYAVAYAYGRVQFGQKITSFQGVRFMIADMATAIEASRGLVYKSAFLYDSGDKNSGTYSAMAKLFASDTAMKVTVDAVQIYGGNGYMREYPVEKLMRDAKITQIYEGTNQIQRDIIGRDIVKRIARS
ncbi:MAG: acyl-CoA dehydrogenase family protein [Planctomycetota bacterium]